MNYQIDNTNTDFRTALTSVYVRRLFLKAKVKILLVVDSAIGLQNNGFDLGRVIDIVESNEFFPCADFTMHSARRTTGAQSVNVNANSHQYRYLGFRFDMAGFDLTDYDQVWFFGFNPGNDGSSSDASVNQAGNSPLTNNELKILATWMDTQGGGVLAMGDHHYLGASMCSKIPRVRNMRRWTNVQNVPPIDGFTRHDTNNPASYPGTVPFDAQADNVPQEIEVLKKVFPGPFVLQKNFIPHPILCGVDGIIDILPDHPHEGETLGKLYHTGTGGIPVDTSLTTGIPAYNVAEYPDGINGNVRPEPKIIALGHPINDSQHDKNERPNNPAHANETTPFGLISTYDGEMAGVGRVVVDSTWHHWLNINLEGFDPASIHYRKIRNFYKNIAVWLSRKSLRSNMMFCSIWDYLVVEFDPMHFSVKDSIWYLGQQARNVLGQIASQCTVTEWIFDFVVVEKQPIFRLPPEPFPCLSCPPFEMMEIAILGGIMKELYPLVEKYRLQEKVTRINISEDELMERALKGVRLGQEEYMQAFKASQKASNKMLKEIPNAIRSLTHEEVAVQVERVKLKIEVDSFLFRDDLIPLILSEGDHHLVFNLSVNENPLVENLKVPARSKLKFKSNESLKGLRQAKASVTLVEEVFEEGEELLVELYLVKDDPDQDEPVKLWEQTFSGPPSGWAGKKQYFLSQEKSDVTVVLNAVAEK